jgi:hypothetical protein
VTISCPFCYPPHPIVTELPATCGTVLELVAHQNVYTSVDCALCGESDRTLVKIGDTYKHSHDCTPGKTIFTVPPPRSRLAAAFWRAPDFITVRIAKWFGRAATLIGDEEAEHYFAWDMVRAYPMKVTMDG